MWHIFEIVVIYPNFLWSIQMYFVFRHMNIVSARVTMVLTVVFGPISDVSGQTKVS